MNTQIIKNKFSQAAGRYDELAILQQEIGSNLLRRIESEIVSPWNILDIGMGTGRLTSEIACIYKDARIFGIDFSYAMLEIARSRISNLLQANAECLPFRDNSFDLLISNLAFQWVNNAQNLFQEASRILKNRGRFYFTTFGTDTLKELRSAFSLPDKRISTDALLMNLCSAGFEVLGKDIKTEKKLYPNMCSLVRWLKYIGANYSGHSVFKGLGARKVWQQAEEYYDNNFRNNGNIFATFEVITISVEKKG